MISDYELNVWLSDVPLKLMPNEKDYDRLLFDGFEYVKERGYKNLTEWVCVEFYISSESKCRARCNTRPNENLIRLGATKHIHPRRQIKSIQFSYDTKP